MLSNNKLRTLFIAAAATTLMACQSGPSEEEVQAEATRVAQEQQKQEQAMIEAEKARATAAAIEKKERAEEMAAKTLDTLKSQQTVYFDFDRSTIKSDFMPILAKHADFLVANPNQRITIEGHCDSRGTPEYNIALGERRAKAIQQYLTTAGVSSSQISVVSYGEEKLAVMGASDYAMAQNRRGVLVYN
ncbi:MAG: peptidoglycan-associated lipoprotein Pal [Glaciecola sp.]